MNKQTAFYLNLIASTICALFVISAHADSESAEHAAHEEHEGSSVEAGPDKGLLAVDEHLGFKLSPGAWKSFGIKTVPASVDRPMVLPKQAIFFGLQERNLFGSGTDFLTHRF